MERLRAQLLTGLAIRAQDTSDMASMTFDQILFKDHPYSRPEDGYPETIQSIARSDLVGFHAEHYGPRGMVISIVGAVEAHEAVRQVKRFLGGWGPLPGFVDKSAKIIYYFHNFHEERAHHV